LYPQQSRLGWRGDREERREQEGLVGREPLVIIVLFCIGFPIVGT
jgi:hypothetical protein